MRVSIPRPRVLFAIAAAALLAGCDDDPNHASYTREKPALKEIIGSYAPDPKTSVIIRKRLGERSLTSRIILRPDQSAIIENIPEWTGATTLDQVGELTNRHGTWSLKQVRGKYWVVDIEYPDTVWKQHDEIILHLQKAPYPLHLRIGDPKTSQSLVFKKEF